MAKSLTTYSAFWSYYLKEHRKPAFRALHYLGAVGALAYLILGVTFEPGLLFFIPLAGYSFAWIEHFFIEKNRPATLTYPLWSLVSDFRTFGLWITGRLGPHLKKARIT